MSETKVPEIDEVSKVAIDELRDLATEGLVRRFESLALENARLKAKLKLREDADAHYGPDFGKSPQLRASEMIGRLQLEKASLRQERDRAVAMLNDANRRLTALLDATEEKDVASG